MIASLCMLLVLAQDGARPVSGSKPTRSAVGTTGRAATAAPTPAPYPLPGTAAGTKKAAKAETVTVLEALVIEVEGRVQWQAAGEETWRVAKLDDLLKPGAQIRSGLRSTMTLRVGKNATLRVGRSSRLELPRIVEKDGTLETRAVFHRGRADIKVDQVGLENDFLVVTPTSTLAVRGTGFRVEWGSLFGVRVTGLPTNELRSIEMRYFSGPRVLMSGADVSSQQRPQPARMALGRTVGRPPTRVFSPAGGDSRQRIPLDARGFDRSFREVRDVQKGGSEVGDVQEESGGGQTEGPPTHEGGGGAP